MLLLDANKTVSANRLLEAVYGEDFPPTARSQLHSSISVLRRVLTRSGGGRILTRTHGYLLEVASDQPDARRFEDLLIDARRARKEGRRDLAVARYRDALRIWRGPALDGIDTKLVRASADRLDEQRMVALGDRIDLELESGRHYELVGELTELVKLHPLRERLCGQLMLALYRCGRAADALDVYRQTRDLMIDELAIEPSEHLRQREHAILNADPALTLATEPARLAEPAGPACSPSVSRNPVSLLPTDVADFTGRSTELGQIRQHLAGPERENTVAAVPIVVLTGRPGIGKSSLAVHAAHDVAGKFPDGQLFADLHGGTALPVHPLQVLERFLRVLGVPSSQIPDGLDERAEVYRSLFNGRRMLVVLDDANSEDQVSPLLPGDGSSAVLITSRHWLTGLPGATHLAVDVFAPGASMELLRRIVGTARVNTQSPEAAAVAAHCGHLPLALRIAGARLSARSHWTIGQLVERLADETRRLDELRHGDLSIRPSISLSYEGASTKAKRLFRRLALLEQPVFSAWQGAALIDRPVAEAEDLLDELASAHLVETSSEEAGMSTHYSFHELIRVFARERLAAEEPAAERKSALRRALGVLLFLAEQANQRYYGGDYLGLHSSAPRWPLSERVVSKVIENPLEWYDSERTAIVFGVRQAARANLPDLCWSLAFSAVTLFESRNYLDEWQETHDIALEEARKAGLVRGRAAMLYSLGSLHIARQRFEQARSVLTEAAWLFKDLSDDQGTALVQRHLAYISRQHGELADSSQRYEQALAMFRKTGDRAGEASVLYGLAQVKLERGEAGIAAELLTGALRLCRAARCMRIEAQVLHRLGDCRLLEGNLAAAVGNYQVALTSTRENGDPIGESYALRGIGLVCIRRGDLGQARVALLRALELSTSAGEHLAESRVRAALSELALASGDPASAIAFGHEAVAGFLSVGVSPDQARALTVLARGYAAAGDAVAAERATTEACALRAKLRA
jgi:DNA-binding SARP family transcriptional activator